MIKIKRSMASVFGWLIPAAVLSSIQRRPRPEGNANGIGILSLKLAGWLRRGPGPWSSGRSRPNNLCAELRRPYGPSILPRPGSHDRPFSFFLSFFLSVYIEDAANKISTESMKRGISVHTQQPPAGETCSCTVF